MTQVQEHRRTAEGNEQGGGRRVPSPSNPRLLTSTIRPNFDPKMARLRCGMLDRSRRSCASPRGTAPLRGPTRRCCARQPGSRAWQRGSTVALPGSSLFGPYRGHPGPRLWRDHQGQRQEPDGASLFADRFDLESLRYRAARRDGGRGQSAADRCATAICPAGITVPRFGERAITLLDLATHSVGLPREIGDVPPNTIPYTWPTKQERWSFLAGYTLPWAPGTVAAYSNVSFDLLADALAAASGKDYPTLLHDRKTGPLGMADTGVAPTPKQSNRLMTGSGFGGPGPCVDTSAAEGNGGLYSTGNDMARWLHHNLCRQRPGGLAEFGTGPCHLSPAPGDDRRNRF